MELVVPAHTAGRRRTAFWTVLTVVASFLVLFAAPAARAATDPCVAPVQVIACENGKPGNPPSEWDIDGDGDPSIQGFGTDISVNAGQAIQFKIKTDARAYSIDIYRTGYYGGNGARKVAS